MILFFNKFYTVNSVNNGFWRVGDWQRLRPTRPRARALRERHPTNEKRHTKVPKQQTSALLYAAAIMGRYLSGFGSPPPLRRRLSASYSL